MGDSELALLGHLIGDGCTLPRHTIQYTTRERDLAELVVQLAKETFGNELLPRINPERKWFQVYLTSTEHLTHRVRNPISSWLDDMGIFGLRSHEKHVPKKVFEQPAPAISLFLRHLWATDGCINLRKTGNGFYPAVFYATSSFRLASDVQSLLIRLGINSRMKKVSQKQKGRDQFHVIITGKEDLQRFINDIKAVGQYRNSSLDQVNHHLSNLSANTNRDVIPLTIWRKFVVPAMERQGVTSRQMQAMIGQAYCGTSLYKQNVSRERAGRVAEAVRSEELAELSTSDVYWDRVESVIEDGVEEVFDLTVPGHHNFIANDIVVHNSIEQDADIVMFIYRDDYYNPDSSERPNIAEINVAKHRNGPTATIDLYWHGQLATFRNLQRQEIAL
jgi:replicative DNA helicase